MFDKKGLIIIAIMLIVITYAFTDLAHKYYHNECLGLGNDGIIEFKLTSLQCYKYHNFTLHGENIEMKRYIVYYKINDSWVYYSEFQDWLI